MEPDRPFDLEYLLMGIAFGFTVFGGLAFGAALVYFLLR